MTTPHWRKAEPSDLPEICAIAAQIHPDLPERSEVLAEKIKLCPEGCLVLAADGAICGYGLAHPWRLNRIPPLDDFLRALPSDADCFYLHDVVVLPALRGKHATDAYVDGIAALARRCGIGSLALVSVYETGAFWQRFGFRAAADDAALRAKLASYGGSARYMICDLRHAPKLPA